MAACWENMAAWMPWNRPSSQPTSWAWATRSSASLGMPLSKGRVSRDSSSRRSGEMPSASSRTDVSKISFRRVRLASSSWARRTSSSSSLVMAPMRMTLAGWEIVSVAVLLGLVVLDDHDRRLVGQVRGRPVVGLLVSHGGSLPHPGVSVTIGPTMGA